MNGSRIRFPEAQSNPHGLPAVERAIAVIQSSRVFTIPQATDLPATGVAGQLIETPAGIFQWNDVTHEWDPLSGGDTDPSVEMWS